MDVHVTEQDGIARQMFPVTGGVALPEGMASAVDGLVLKDRAGRPVDLQTEVLSRWRDGSIRWVLLDFQTDLNALETRTFRLEKQDGPGLPLPLPAVEPTGVEDGEPLPRRVRGVALKGSTLRVLDAVGEWTTREPGPTVLERKGGLRTTVRTSGAVVSPDGSRRIGWEARTDFYRGKEWSRTRFTYLGDVGPEPIRLKELALVAVVEAGKRPEYCYASANAPWGVETAPLICGKAGYIIQKDANDSSVIASSGEVLRAQTLKNRGYVGISRDGSGLALGLAEMWQAFPKAMRATGTTLEALLWPAEAEEEFSLSPGMARTHTLTVAAYRDAGELDALLTSLTTPILPRQTVESVNASGVMPALLPRGKTGAPFMDAMTELMFTGFNTFAAFDSTSVWGLGERHFGDFRAPGYEKRQLPGLYGKGTVWGNQEAQVPYGFLVQYLRTGRVECLLQGLACARHQADVDTIHAATDREQVGGQHVHGADHTAGGVGTDHMWTSGMALAYFLTGDRRLKSVLNETGEYLLRYSSRRGLDQYEARAGGWLLICLCANYEVSGDERYLLEGRRVVEGLRRWIVRGATKLLPPHMHAFSPIYVFIALTGVADYWRLTRDELARDTLLAGGRMTLEKGLSDIGFFIMQDGQSYRLPAAWQTCHSLPIMNVLYELTGERRWIETGMRQARLMLAMMEGRNRWGEEANWAQGGIFFAYAFPFFETARKLGLLTDIR